MCGSAVYMCDHVTSNHVRRSIDMNIMDLIATQQHCRTIARAVGVVKRYNSSDDESEAAFTAFTLTHAVRVFKGSLNCRTYFLLRETSSSQNGHSPRLFSSDSRIFCPWSIQDRPSFTSPASPPFFKLGAMGVWNVPQWVLAHFICIELDCSASSI